MEKNVNSVRCFSLSSVKFMYKSSYDRIRCTVASIFSYHVYEVNQKWIDVTGLLFPPIIINLMCEDSIIG